MFIDISEIISTDNKSLDYRPEPDMESLEYSGFVYPIVRKEPLALNVANTGRSRVKISGSADMTLLIPCDRCLKDVEVPMNFDFSQELDFAKIREGDPQTLEEVPFIDGNLLDVDRFVRNELIVHLPTKVLCREDCAGLCPVCGKDLNEGDCGCEKEPADIRMSAIRDIFKDFKEV